MTSSSVQAAFAPLALVLALPVLCLAADPTTVVEYPIAYPNMQPSHHGSTHEIVFNKKSGNTIWITGQKSDAVVRVTPDGQMSFIALPAGSGPHGIVFDAAGQLWVTLEFAGKVVRLDPSGKILTEFDVRLDCTTCSQKINTYPHGLAVGPDGQTLWYTGKGTGTVGRITPDGKIHTYPLPTVGSVPIYIKAGPDGNMWLTELVGNRIARVTPSGEVSEFAITTYNSRPISIVPDPRGNGMWFSEESGNKVARIDLDGKITEFPVPKTQNNVILAGLAFDGEGNLWTQQYVDQNNPGPVGTDHIVKIDKAILNAKPSDISKVAFTFYETPSSNTVMHRIIEGPDGNMWFTQMKADRVGKVIEPK